MTSSRFSPAPFGLSLSKPPRVLSVSPQNPFALSLSKCPRILSLPKGLSLSKCPSIPNLSTCLCADAGLRQGEALPSVLSLSKGQPERFGVRRVDRPFDKLRANGWALGGYA